MWRKKCKDEKHNWTEWELRWDSKKGKFWIRWCVNCGCGAVEKSTDMPPPEEKRQKITQEHPNVIQWLETQMSK